MSIHNFKSNKLIKWFGLSMVVLISLGLGYSLSSVWAQDSDQFSVSAITEVDQLGNKNLAIRIEADSPPFKNGNLPFIVQAYYYQPEANLQCSLALAKLNSYDRNSFAQADISSNGYYSFKSLRVALAFYRYKQAGHIYRYSFTDSYDHMLERITRAADRYQRDDRRHKTLGGYDQFLKNFKATDYQVRLCILVTSLNYSQASLIQAEYDIYLNKPAIFEVGGPKELITTVEVDLDEPQFAFSTEDDQPLMFLTNFNWRLVLIIKAITIGVAVIIAAVAVQFSKKSSLPPDFNDYRPQTTDHLPPVTSDKSQSQTKSKDNSSASRPKN